MEKLITKVKGTIPGHGILGKGFDIFGRLDSSSAKAVLFDTSKPDNRIWNDSAADIDYVMTQNVADPEPTGKQDGTCITFDSKSDFSSSLSMELNVKGSSVAFGGEFDAQFSEVRNTTSEHHMALLMMKSSAFRLQLIDDSANSLDQHVLKDPDFLNLPKKFDRADNDNVRRFLRFFEKYGTHYVYGVELGGRMDYCMYIDKSYSYSSTDISAKLKLEFNAAFVSGEASAGVAWSSVGKEWAERRTIKLKAIGPNSALNAILPSYGSNFNDVFEAWLGDVRRAPMPISFNLKPIYNLFSDNQYDAIKEALDYYTNNHISIKIIGKGAMNKASGYIDVNGKSLKKPEFQGPGIQVAAISRHTLEKLVTGSFVFDGLTTQYTYKSAVDLIGKYANNSEAFLVIALWDVHPNMYPSDDFLALLSKIGAGTAIQSWFNAKGITTPNGSVSYGIVGIPGISEGRAAEEILLSAVAHAKPATMAVEAFLEPSFRDNAICFQLS